MHSFIDKYKGLLREALREILPTEIIEREKSPNI